MLGLQPVGIASSAMGVAVVAAVLVYQLVGGDHHRSVLLVATVVVNALCLVAWSFVVRRNWVGEQALN
jgi:hypothetical protein